MDPNASALERAFELARSGRCDCVTTIRRKLRDEGYTAEQITGPLLEKQLKELISQSKGAAD